MNTFKTIINTIIELGFYTIGIGIMVGFIIGLPVYIIMEIFKHVL
jgi:hypothetical protein